jgi:hypothetical protein
MGRDPYENQRGILVEPSMQLIDRAASADPGVVPTYRGPFAVMTVLFFMWGFMTVFNDILIPRFKQAFTLNYFEAMLVQFAFFGAYFIGALLYFLISATAGDPIARIGYKNGVVIGLLVSAAAPCSGRRRPSCPIRCFWSRCSSSDSDSQCCKSPRTRT